MNIVDFILVIVALLSVWLAWKKGFIKAAADLIVWVGSLVIAFFGYPYAAIAMQRFMHPSPWIFPLAFLLVLVLAGWLLSFLLHLVTRNISVTVQRSRLNHALGILPGFVNACISAAIVALLLLSMPFGDGFSAEASSSRIADKLIPPAEWLQEKLAPVFNEAVKQSMTKLTVEPGSEETVKLPFTKDHPKMRPDLEAAMLDLVNAERIKKGLKKLAPDTALTQVARAHSEDMFARGYFSHYTPEKKDPFDRMKKAHIHYLAAGENLALAQTLSIAHNGLMNSPGHRANILSPHYGRLGIGIADGGMHGLMISQEFRN